MAIGRAAPVDTNHAALPSQFESGLPILLGTSAETNRVVEMPARKHAVAAEQNRIDKGIIEQIADALNRSGSAMPHAGAIKTIARMKLEGQKTVCLVCDSASGGPNESVIVFLYRADLAKWKLACFRQSDGGAHGFHFAVKSHKLLVLTRIAQFRSGQFTGHFDDVVAAALTIGDLKNGTHQGDARRP